MEKLIITFISAVQNLTKDITVPYTVEEMVREAKSAYEAVRYPRKYEEDDGTPTQSKERYKEVMNAI